MATKTKKKVSLRPLHDKILVKRDEAASKTESGIFLPRSQQGQTQDRHHRGRRRRRPQHRDRQPNPPHRQEGRPSHLQQLLRHRDQDRRPGPAHHVRGRHPRRGRLIGTGTGHWATGTWENPLSAAFPGAKCLLPSAYSHDPHPTPTSPRRTQRRTRPVRRLRDVPSPVPGVANLEVKKAMLIPDEADHLVKVTDGKAVYVLDADRVAWIRIGLK
jgi:hypothetical protein